VSRRRSVALSILQVQMVQ